MKFKTLFFRCFGLLGALLVFNVNQLTQVLIDILLTSNGEEVGLIANFSIGFVLVTITA